MCGRPLTRGGPAGGGGGPARGGGLCGAGGSAPRGAPSLAGDVEVEEACQYLYERGVVAYPY
ncbi:hypothetical protein ABZ357_39605, partial [Streptomyces sp. NPDC005917]|uniref:hypothetical protein n=1 Tax=Streptomyces sp. NPDC005917 TaxID=3155347 RepID=UPI0033E79393